MKKIWDCQIQENNREKSCHNEDVSTHITAGDHVIKDSFEESLLLAKIETTTHHEWFENEFVKRCFSMHGRLLLK